MYNLPQVRGFRVRNPLSLYMQLVLEPYLEAASAHHARHASQLLQQTNVSNYMQRVLEGKWVRFPRAGAIFGCSMYLQKGSPGSAKCGHVPNVNVMFGRASDGLL